MQGTQGCIAASSIPCTEALPLATASWEQALVVAQQLVVHLLAVIGQQAEQIQTIEARGWNAQGPPAPVLADLPILSPLPMVSVQLVEARRSYGVRTIQWQRAVTLLERLALTAAPHTQDRRHGALSGCQNGADNSPLHRFAEAMRTHRSEGPHPYPAREDQHQSTCLSAKETLVAYPTLGFKLKQTLQMNTVEIRAWLAPMEHRGGEHRVRLEDEEDRRSEAMLRGFR